MQVTMVLLRARQNMTRALVAEWYEVSLPTVSRAFRRVRPLFGQVLRVHGPAIETTVANRVVLANGTDIPRAEEENTDENYSGKRHRQELNIPRCWPTSSASCQPCHRLRRAAATAAGYSRRSTGQNCRPIVDGSPIPHISLLEPPPRKSEPRAIA